MYTFVHWSEPSVTVRTLFISTSVCCVRSRLMNTWVGVGVESVIVTVLDTLCSSCCCREWMGGGVPSMGLGLLSDWCVCANGAGVATK